MQQNNFNYINGGGLEESEPSLICLIRFTIASYKKLKDLVHKKRVKGYSVEEIAEMLEESQEMITSIVKEIEQK